MLKKNCTNVVVHFCNVIIKINNPIEIMNDFTYCKIN